LVIDFFPFNGEHISFQHIAYLKDAVDFFILIESDSAFSNTTKKNFYYADRYSDVLRSLNSTGKIIVEKISFSKLRENATAWDREDYQRDIARDIVLDRFPDTSFVLIIGDADEIPRKEVVQKLASRYDELLKPFYFVMLFHYYSFKWVNRREMWAQSFVISSVGLQNLTHGLSVIRRKNSLRIPDRKMNEIHDAGWHCSWCMNSSDIVRKLSSFSHQEYNIKAFRDINWIDRCRREGLDLFNRSALYHGLMRYKGRKGYPACEECKSLPDYSLVFGMS